VNSGDPNVFEILLGTDNGQILHAGLEYRASGFEMLSPFVSILELED
jgi:hypothetical protein